MKRRDAIYQTTPARHLVLIMKAMAITLTSEQITAIARALADPRRFAIFEQIAQCNGLPCSALAEHEAISPATVSHHLKELLEAGLIEAVREGRTMSLSVCRPVWDAYLKRLHSM